MKEKIKENFTIFCCGFALGVLIVTTALLVFNYIL